MSRNYAAGKSYPKRRDNTPALEDQPYRPNIQHGSYGSSLGGQHAERAREAGGYQNLGGGSSYYKKPGSSIDLSGLGGLLGGGGGGARFAEEDLERQLEYDKAIWERSTPNVSGVGGNVVWDRDTNTVTSTLSPEYQAIYDSMNKRGGMFGDLANNLASGGWKDAQKQLFDQQRALYAEGDQIALDQLREREVAMGRGAESTAGFHERRAMQSGKDQRDIGLMNNAFAQSQGLIDSNLNRQRNDVATMMNLGGVANNMIKMPTPNTSGNMANVSLASTRWADNLAMETAKKQKGMADMWGSILGGVSSLFGV